MNKKLITEDTIIKIGKPFSQGHFFDFFREATGKDLPYGEHSIWLNTQIGQPVRDAIGSWHDAAKLKSVEQKLSEERFDNISELSKAFIVAFDKAFEELGYDYGGGIGDGYGWGKYMIIYGKTGVKSRPCPARIYIKDNGEIQLRLFLKNIDKHRKYIEATPAHIKDAFAFEGGDCKNCMPTCKTMKIYTIDGQQYNKCCHSTAYFSDPSVEKLPQYMALYTEFNPTKKSKSVK
jgi:hypothetical protein